MPDGGASAPPPVIGVIVVNWNRPEDTLACLQSLHEAQPRPHRVVLVDNGSSDDSVSRAREWANSRNVAVAVHSATGAGKRASQPPWVAILTSSSNLGFSGGNNVGLDYLRRDAAISHFLLLNNDATIAPDFLGEIVAALAVSRGAGLMTGTIYHHPDRSRVWYAGGKETPWRALVSHQYDVPADGAPRPTEFVSGCAMIVSRPLLEALGPLPECYFPGYSEDAEYSRRARDAGFPVVYAPRAIAYHRVGATAGHARSSPAVLQAQMRHRVYYARRSFRGLERVIALAYLAVTKPGKALVETISGRPAMGAAILRGTAEGFFRRV